MVVGAEVVLTGTSEGGVGGGGIEVGGGGTEVEGGGIEVGGGIKLEGGGVKGLPLITQGASPQGLAAARIVEPQQFSPPNAR